MADVMSEDGPSATLFHPGVVAKINSSLSNGGGGVDLGVEIARLERDRDERPAHHFWEDLAASHLLTCLYLKAGRVGDALHQNCLSLEREPRSINAFGMSQMMSDMLADEERRCDDELQRTTTVTDDECGEDVARPGVPDDRTAETFSDASKSHLEDKDHAQKVVENGEYSGGDVPTSTSVDEESETSCARTSEAAALGTSKCDLKRPLSSIQEEDHNSNEKTPTPSNDFTMNRLSINETANAGDEDTVSGDADGGILIPPVDDVNELFRSSSPPPLPLQPPTAPMTDFDFFEQQVIAAAEVARCFDLLDSGGRRRPFLTVDAIALYAEAIDVARRLISDVRQLPSTSTAEEPLRSAAARLNLWRSRLVTCYRRSVDTDDGDLREVLAAVDTSMPLAEVATVIDEMIASGETRYAGRAIAERAAIGYRLQTMRGRDGVPPSLKVNVRECCRQARIAAGDVDSTTLEVVGRTMRREARSDADLREAIEVLKKAAELDRTLDGAYHQLGLAYRSLWLSERTAEAVRRGEDESNDEEEEAAADKPGYRYLITSTEYLERALTLNANYQCLMDMAKNLVYLGRRDEAKFYTDEARFYLDEARVTKVAETAGNESGI